MVYKLMIIGTSMKIFVITKADLSEQTAQPVHVMEIIRNLKKIGCEITLFAPHPRIKNQMPKVSQLRIRHLPNSNLPILRSITIEFCLFFYLLFYSIRQKPQLFYTRMGWFMISPLLVSKLVHRPHIIEVNGLVCEEATMSGGSNAVIFIITLIERTNYKFSSKIVAVTKGLKKEIQVLYKLQASKIVVIQNGVNIDLFRQMNVMGVRKKLNLNQNRNYVCFVGNLAPWQGVEYLIQSAPLILKENPNVKFLIVGDGRMKEELVELAAKTGVSDKFIFTGAVHYEEVPKYINASDVCVVSKKPLKSGYSPLKLYEYMACGKPVVASNLPGFEILEENDAGVLVEPENPEELAKAIVKLLKDEKLRAEMGRNGREYVVKNHSWESVARRVAEVCESAVRENKNKSR